MLRLSTRAFSKSLISVVAVPRLSTLVFSKSLIVDVAVFKLSIRVLAAAMSVSASDSFKSTSSCTAFNAASRSSVASTMLVEVVK